MTTYRYLFADLRTNQIIAELPLTGVNATQQLNSAGTATGHLLLSGLNAAGANVLTATTPARNALYIDRDGVLVWGGIVWNRAYNSDTQQLTITAREFESYFERRRITTTQVFSNQDQFTVVNTLVNNMQAVTGGDIGIVVPSVTSGTLVTKVFYQYEYKSVMSAIQDLSRATTGFDFTIQVAYDANGNPTKTLSLNAPRSGYVYSSTDPNAFVLQFPAGNVISYEYPEEGASTANTLYAIGMGYSDGKFLATATDPNAVLSQGWPVLEDTVSYSDVYNQSLLNTLAAGKLAAVATPPVVVKVTVPPYVDPVFGSYKVGDDMRLLIRDDLFPSGLDTVYRLVGSTLQPGENNQGERAVLTLSQYAT